MMKLPKATMEIGKLKPAVDDGEAAERAHGECRSWGCTAVECVPVVADWMGLTISITKRLVAA